jgi:hypothetical protein
MAAERIADGAEAHEVGVTGEVETVGLARRRGRHQQRPQTHPVAWLQRRLRFAQADPDLGRGRGRIELLDRQLAEGQPLAAHPILDQEHPAFQHMGAAALQHRRCDQRGAERGRAQADGDRCQSDQRRQAQRLGLERLRIAWADQGEHDRQQERRSQPEGGLRAEAEVQADAETDPDREPQQPTLALLEQPREQPGHEARAQPPEPRDTEAGAGERRRQPEGAVRHGERCARRPSGLA